MPSGRTPSTPTRPAWRPRPTRHATGAPNASCMQLHRHLRHHRASSTAEPIPRLEATQNMTQRRQPGATVNATKNGPIVMAVAGGQEQRSRRQPSSRPIRGQQENPLSWCEDNAPVIRSSNGSRTRNDHPANHSPRRIKLRGGTGDASGRSSGRRFAFAETTAPKKVRRVVRFRILFPFFLFLYLLRQGPGKGDTPKGILPCEGTGLRAPLLIRGSKAGPPKGSTAASDRVGPTPTTGQRFEGRPPEGFHGRLRLLGLRAHY